MKQPEVTCILTSCGRFYLLRKTLESFVKHNTYDIKLFFVSDDSGEKIPHKLRIDFPFIIWQNSSQSGVFKNQIASLDYLWQHVQTPYAFTMEDDWEFLKDGFIESSMPILEKCPDILQVWLQPLEDHNVHPTDWSNPGFGILAGGNLHAGIRFNPSLKRKADYDLIAPFAQHTTWNSEKPWKSEADIAKVYSKLGFKAAILPERYIKHIGENEHIGP